MIPLLVPLFLNALRRAEDLSLAMEARGYVGGRGRTSFIRLKSRPRDYLALVLVLSFCLFILRYDFTALDAFVVGTLQYLVWGAFSLTGH